MLVVFFQVIGVEIYSGDPIWRLVPTWADAVALAKSWDECYIDTIKVYEINGATLESKERTWQ